MSGGSLIKEARRRAGLSQHDLGQRVGVSQSQIARWETHRTEPSHRAVMQAVRAAGFTIDIHLEPDDGSDLAQARRSLRSSAAQRSADGVADTNAMLDLQHRAMTCRRPAT